jgi:hypothetical protein
MRSLHLLVLLLATPVLAAQSAPRLLSEQVGAITGTVADPDGATFAEASVRATDVETKAVRKAVTSTTGVYTLADVPPGTYDLFVGIPGMKPHTQPGVVVRGGETVRIDVRLEDGPSLRTLGEDPASIIASLKRPPAPTGAAPKSADGRPDLTGIWTPTYEPNPKSERPAPLPWAAELAKERTANNMKDLPASRCLPAGVPLLTPMLTKIVQTPAVIVMLFEGDVPGYRQVFLDGREHPAEPNPTWQGHAVGRWDHDTLVIDSVGFNDRSWLSYAGHPHTEAMRLTERMRRPDAGHLEIEVVVNDPGAFSKPWKTVRVYELTPADEIQEYICSENNKYGQLVPE